MSRAHEMIEALVNTQLVGIEIDEFEGFVRFNFANGYVQIDGEDMDFYIELDEVN